MVLLFELSIKSNALNYKFNYFFVPNVIIVIFVCDVLSFFLHSLFLFFLLILFHKFLMTLLRSFHSLSTSRSTLKVAAKLSFSHLVFRLGSCYLRATWPSVSGCAFSGLVFYIFFVLFSFFSCLSTKSSLVLTVTSRRHKVVLPKLVAFLDNICYCFISNF